MEVGAFSTGELQVVLGPAAADEREDGVARRGHGCGDVEQGGVELDRFDLQAADPTRGVAPLDEGHRRVPHLLVQPGANTGAAVGRHSDVQLVGPGARLIWIHRGVAVAAHAA